MDIEEILLIFTKISGLTEEDATNYRFLCEAAISYVEARLKENISLSKYTKSLNYTAAATAYYRYTLMKVSDGTGTEIRVGDIISKRNAIDQANSAEELCRQAYNDISEILKDNGFAFTSVG